LLNLFLHGYLGIKTGGYAPHLWLVEDGNDPTLSQFGLIEAQAGRNAGHSYMIRTRLNVEYSDGTIVFGSIDSQQDKGSFNTIQLAVEMGKPYFHAETRELLDDSVQKTAAELRQWIIDNDIQVLNVAGNRGSQDPRLKGLVERVLKVALREPVRENLPQVVLSEGRALLPREPLDPTLKTIQYRMLIDPSDKLARVDDGKLFGAIDALVNRTVERAVEQGFEQIEFVLDSEQDSPGWVVKAIAQRSHQTEIKVGVHVGAETRAKRDQSIMIAVTAGNCVAINLAIASSIAAKEFVVVYDASTEQYKSFNAPDVAKPKTSALER
jgi:Circularly permutated YpsA SLOG family